jgi:hypothetical protein
LRNHEYYGFGPFAWDVAYLYRVGGFMGIVFGVSVAVLSYQIRNMGDRRAAPVDAPVADAAHCEPGSEYFLG